MRLLRSEAVNDKARPGVYPNFEEDGKTWEAP
jgi:hypothetical protein